MQKLFSLDCFISGERPGEKAANVYGLLKK